MVDRLRQQHALGLEAEISKDEGTSTADFAAGHPYSVHTMRKFKAFADRFSLADLNELCRGRRPNGLPLHWGYVSILLAIEGKHDKATRKKFQRLAIDEGWTVPKLYHEVREQLGVSGHGRTPMLPERAGDGLESLAESLEFLQRRCEKLKEVADANGDKLNCRKCRRLSEALTAARKIAKAG